MTPRELAEHDNEIKDTKRVSVVLPVETRTLSWFLEFDEPEQAMALALSAYRASFREDAMPCVDDNEKQDDPAPPQTGLVETDPQLEEIRLRLVTNDPNLTNYGKIRAAAAICHRHFGSSWVYARQGYPEFRLRERLRKLVGNSVARDHANKSVPWGRFQDYVRECDD